MHSIRLLLAVATASVCGIGHAAQSSTAELLFQRALSDLPDKEMLAVTVEYPPGVASSPHRHNAHTFVYVLEGSVVMQVEGGDEVTLEAGGTFYETPADIHTVSRNASDADPAKILVVFVKQAGAPATVPAN